MELGIILLIGLVYMALTSETPQLRTRRLALIGLLLLIAFMLRHFR